MVDFSVSGDGWHQAVIADGLSISQVAEKVGVSRRTLHAWLARYEAEGLMIMEDRTVPEKIEGSCKSTVTRCPRRRFVQRRRRAGRARRCSTAVASLRIR